MIDRFFDELTERFFDELTERLIYFYNKGHGDVKSKSSEQLASIQECAIEIILVFKNINTLPQG